MEVYLDYNATTPTMSEVVEAMEPYFTQLYGNPSSEHNFGRLAKEAIEESRLSISSLLSANSLHKIIFLSGATEANNLAIIGYAYANIDRGNHIITQETEHESILQPLKYLQREGFKITYLPVDKYGRIDVDDLKRNIKRDTILVSIQYANNETGTIQPIREIGEIAKEYQIVFHTDAAQIPGKLKINVEEEGIDMLSLSGHKMYAPKGIGVLYIREEVNLEPILRGGMHQYGLRAGTENVAGIVGIGKAAQILKEDIREEEQKSKRDRLYKGIVDNFGDLVLVHGHPELRLPNTLNITFKGVEAPYLLRKLAKRGIGVSIASACSSISSKGYSHVLKAIYKERAPKEGSIRFSLGRYTKDEEIDYTISAIYDILKSQN